MSKISEKKSITLEEMEQLTKCLVEKRNKIYQLQNMIRNIVSEIKNISKELENKTFYDGTHSIHLDKIYLWNGSEVSFEGSQINKKTGRFNKQLKTPITSDNIINSAICSYFEKNGYKISNITESACSILDKKYKTEEDLEVLRWIRLYILIDFPRLVLKEFKEEYKQCLTKMYTEENIGCVEDINMLETMENIKDVDTLVLNNY